MNHKKTGKARDGKENQAITSISASAINANCSTVSQHGKYASGTTDFTRYTDFITLFPKRVYLCVPGLLWQARHYTGCKRNFTLVYLNYNINIF